MKKTTTFFLCLIATVGATIGQNDITKYRGTAGLTDYEDRAVFEADYGRTLINEDFSGGPTGDFLTDCGGEISSAVIGCFQSGVLKEGFKITTKTNEGVNYVAINGSPGVTMPMIGAKIGPNITVLTFILTDIYAFGFDLYAATRENTELRIYDRNGELLNTFTATNPFNTTNFFSIISDTPIGKVEIQAEQNGIELIGNLAFGRDVPLSINDNTLVGFNFYPNPVSDVLNINANQTMESVSLFNMLGQNVLTSKVNNTSSAINISELSAGTYIMRVTVDKQISTYKIMKN